MKKIININLSGRVIPIEDSAYESLQRYIESLRRYFAAEEGRDEIINDIESRIAELMNDKVRKGAAAVTDADIEEIIASMGRIEDFEEADATEGAAAAEPTASGARTTGAKRFTGRLYRDKSDKILGGVCSGIANYINVDPAIVRLLFAIITFGGFGFGIFLYILAWIILPASDLNTYTGKRLFRNPDDRIIGGVAGGLAAYFNKDAWVVRLIFAAPILLNILISILRSISRGFDGPENIFVGSFAGTFILAYIILWIVLPEAKSPYEKMEMRGETVDVNRIRQNVQEGMSDFRGRAQAWGQEVRTSAEQLGARASTFANTRGRAFAEEVGQTARPVASGLSHAIGILFKAFFLFIAGSIAFGLFIGLIVFAAGGVAEPFHDFMINGFWQRVSLWGVLLFFLAVPLIALITWIVRRMMRVRSQNRYIGWTFAGLWMLGWISLFLFITSMVSDWRFESRTEQSLTPGGMALNKMVVQINEPKIQYSGNFAWMDDDNDSGWDITDDSLHLANVKIRVDKSSDSLYRVTLWKYSQGSNRAEARQRAERITYTAATLDSALIIGSGFGVSKDQKFRGQRVIVAISVPVGKMIRFDESVGKLDYTNIRVAERNGWRERRWEVDWDNDDFYDWKPGVDYMMTASGELVDVNNPSGTGSSIGTYEYRGGDTSGRGVLDSQIEQQRRRVEEENRRLEDLQRNRNQNSTQIKVGDDLIIETEEPTASLRTHFFSIII